MTLGLYIPRRPIRYHDLGSPLLSRSMDNESSKRLQIHKRAVEGDALSTTSPRFSSTAGKSLACLCFRGISAVYLQNSKTYIRLYIYPTQGPSSAPN